MAYRFSLVERYMMTLVFLACASLYAAEKSVDDSALHSSGDSVLHTGVVDTSVDQTGSLDNEDSLTVPIESPSVEGGSYKADTAATSDSLPLDDDTDIDSSMLPTDTAEAEKASPDGSENGVSADSGKVSAGDSGAKSNKLVVEGIVISARTGEFPRSDSVQVTVDSIKVTPDEDGMFRVEIGARNYFTVQVFSSDYELFREVVKTDSGQKNYFVSCALKERREEVSVQKPAENTHGDTARYVPWTISGTIIDSRVDLAVESDSTVLTFDGDTVPNTSKGNFYISSRIGGRHVLHFTSKGYNEVVQEIILDKNDKQPFIVISTSPLGHEITKREIVVSAKAEPLHESAEISKIKVEQKELQRTAATLSDPMRVLLTLPGVTSSSDLSSRPIVRGGELHQTRVYLDGISLMQPYHYGGLHSTFNQLALDDITMYSSGFPSRFGNSLSALVIAETRRPAEEPPQVAFDLNYLQSAAYAGMPLFDNKAGINASWQGSYYQHTTNLMVNLLGDEENKKVFEEITLPDYNDFSLGFQYRPDARWSFSLNESFNSDRTFFCERDSVVPVENHIPGGECVNDEGVIRCGVDTLRRMIPIDDFKYYEYENFDAVGRPVHVVDTLIKYKSNYNVLGANADHAPNDNWVFKGALAWQKRWWDLNFPKEFSDFIDTTIYDISINQVNGSVGAVYSGMENHLLGFGLQVDHTYSKYRVFIPRVLNEIITKGRTDYSDFWGPISGDSAMVLSDISDPEFFDLKMVERLFIRYRGERSYINTGLYVNDSWNIGNRLKADIGLRLETCTADRSATLSPRFTLKYNLKEKTELMISGGRYTQNNYEPAAIALSENLGPEKTWHADFGTETRLLPWLTLKSNFYYKAYSGLLSEVMKSAHDIELSRSKMIEKLSQQYPYEDLDDLSYEELIELFDLQTSYYTNEGRGYACGWENFLRFEFADFWHGWISLSVGKSRRQRMPGWRWHDFPLETPVLLSFVNYYRLPRRYEFSVKYRYIYGMPYTPTRFTYDSLMVADFNSGRLAPYQSLDFRFSKGFVTNHFKGHWYLEVWNSFNSPNMLRLDNSTKRLQGTRTNLPVPVIFLGVDFKLL
ncbi:MAG: TonB-dependent receptor plug domain-containing protein [Chitinispirillaceae bacterium]